MRFITTVYKNQARDFADALTIYENRGLPGNIYPRKPNKHQENCGVMIEVFCDDKFNNMAFYQIKHNMGYYEGTGA